MDPLLVPKSGIALVGAPNADAKNSKPDTKPTQVMRLDLAEGMFNELLRSVRSGGKGIHVSFGKIPVCIPYLPSLTVTPTANVFHVHRHSTTGRNHNSLRPHLQPSARNFTAILRTKTTDSNSPAGSATILEWRRHMMSRREQMQLCSNSEAA